MTDPTTDAILDAARASVQRFGIRRTTLSDIARLAGVSRMTVYRRYPDLPALLRELMTREFSCLMDAVEQSVDGPDGRSRLVARVDASMRALRDHPLLRKVLEAEPELLLPYVLGRMGETQRRGAALIARDLAQGQADGSVRAGDLRAMAQALLLVTQSFLLSGGIAEDVAEDRLLAELELLLEAALRPSEIA